MSSFMFGLMVGSITLGSFSDMFGRKFATYVTLTLMIASVAWGGFATSFPIYCLTRAVNGFFCGGHMLALMVLCNELIGSEHRGKAAACMTTCWSLGTDTTNSYIAPAYTYDMIAGILLVALIAYQLRNWRDLTEVVALCGVPLIITFFFLPESPRWLLQKGRVDQANEVIRDIASGKHESPAIAAHILYFYRRQIDTVGNGGMSYYRRRRHRSIIK